MVGNKSVEDGVSSPLQPLPSHKISLEEWCALRKMAVPKDEVAILSSCFIPNNCTSLSPVLLAPLSSQGRVTSELLPVVPMPPSPVFSPVSSEGSQASHPSPHHQHGGMEQAEDQQMPLHARRNHRLPPLADETEAGTPGHSPSTSHLKLAVVLSRMRHRVDGMQESREEFASPLFGMRRRAVSRVRSDMVRGLLGPLRGEAGKEKVEDGHEEGGSS